MQSQIRDAQLEIVILRALAAYKRGAARNVIVIARPDGIVHLRGVVPTFEDRRAMETLIKGISGVHTVFCNVMIQA
jgi:osmotically-inducible protein OsmY